MFQNIFDTVPERAVGNTDNLYFILYGGSLTHRVVWPKQETFETNSKQSCKYGAFHFANFVATDDADVHIVKTAIEAYEKIKKQAVVIGQDLLVLPTALTPDYMDILMLKEGKGKIKDRFYSSKDLRNSNLFKLLFLRVAVQCDDEHLSCSFNLSISSFRVIKDFRDILQIFTVVEQLHCV
ncbi:hypothetical protein AVEN_149854-1 [Araneus ventricosus]|uniref:Uncharacterized protein n=1 Tax=Araneus ventricosus TaxID=182803 RepID=A0A4Y2DWI2_ARAVE|nr:hypothetical protein AVEN_149854-1 [Araneus ventricosus]